VAEAGDEDTPPGWKWVLYSEYLEDKLAEVLSPELADRIGRKEIREKRLRYRYLDRNGNLHYDCYHDHDGNLHYDSLTDEFWREAILDRETSSMVWLVPARFYNHVEPTYEVLGIESERDVRIFRLEVLVPAPTEAAPTTQSPKSVETAPTPAGNMFYTGGRSSARPLVRQEATSRISKGKVKPTYGRLNAFARDIAAWWEKQRQSFEPPGPSMSVGSIENVIRDLWKRSLGKT
jgi:hypothetical protein